MECKLEVDYRQVCARTIRSAFSQSSIYISTIFVILIDLNMSRLAYNSDLCSIYCLNVSLHHQTASSNSLLLSLTWKLENATHLPTEMKYDFIAYIPAADWSLFISLNPSCFLVFKTNVRFLCFEDNLNSHPTNLELVSTAMFMLPKAKLYHLVMWHSCLTAPGNKPKAVSEITEVSLSHSVNHFEVFSLDF